MELPPPCLLYAIHPLSMFSNYFKIAYRSLLKHKLFSFINIVGLGLSIPFALIALMQIQSTYESDNFHPYTARTFRITTDVSTKNGSKQKYASTPYRLAEKLKKDYPSIEKATKVCRQYDWELTNKIKTIQVNCVLIEPEFFDIFGFALQSGTPPVEPNTLVMTADMAHIFFGDVDPIGKVVSHPEYGDLKITGILKPYKRNTHLRTDVMVSLSTMEHSKKKKANLEDWNVYDDAFTYVLMDSMSGNSGLNTALNSIAVAIAAQNASRVDQLHFSSQAINDISPDHQNLKNNPYVEDWADLSVNFIFALLLIVLAGFNYTNLTLARSLSRAKEVGIRKVSGALRSQLVIQFISEALLITSLALVLGYFILQWMKVYVHVTWFSWEVDRPWVLGGMGILFTLFIGILAGAMPAWLLSGLQPVSVLKGVLNPMSFGKVGLRKSLVVIQFVVTTCFIFMIGHMYHQFAFMATDNINFNRKNILNISLSDNNYQNLVNEFKLNKNVNRVGLVSTPFGHHAISGGIRQDPHAEYLPTYYYAANAEFIENMHLQLIGGKNLPFLTQDSADHRVLINEQAAIALGWSNAKDAIGKPFYYNNEAPMIVQGVLKNFCYSNYQYDLQPILIQYNPALFKVISMQLNQVRDKDAIISTLRNRWKAHYPYEDLSYSWYEKEMYDRYYPGADMRFLGLISFIILVIALMGLLGIVIYTIEKRVREIGIRKVIGAAISDIVKELSVSFVKLLVLANLIAIPIGYISGRLVLSVFTFHDGVSIRMMMSIVAGVSLIAMSTIVFNAAVAANSNPVKSLRIE